MVRLRIIALIIFLCSGTVYSLCINVTSPVGGDQFEINDIIRIKWTNSCNLSGNVKILMRRIGVYGEILIKESHPIDDPEVYHTIKGPITGGKFIIEVRKNVEIKARSGEFTIKGSLLPTLSVKDFHGKVALTRSDYSIASISGYNGFNLDSDICYTLYGAKKVPVKTTVKWNKTPPDPICGCNPLLDLFIRNQKIVTARVKPPDVNGISEVKTIIDIPSGFPVDSFQWLKARLRFDCSRCDTVENNNSRSVKVKLWPEADFKISIRRVTWKKVWRYYTFKYKISCVVAIKNIGKFKSGTVRYMAKLANISQDGRIIHLIDNEYRHLNKTINPGQEFIREIKFKHTVTKEYRNRKWLYEITSIVDPPHPKTGKIGYLEANLKNNVDKKRFRINN